MAGENWLLERAMFRREIEIATVRIEIRRQCVVCGASMERGTTCQACRRAHRSPRVCACGCGEHLDMRNPGAITRKPACSHRLAERVAAAEEALRVLASATSGADE